MVNKMFFLTEVVYDCFQLDLSFLRRVFITYSNILTDKKSQGNSEDFPEDNVFVPINILVSGRYIQMLQIIFPKQCNGSFIIPVNASVSCCYV